MLKVKDDAVMTPSPILTPPTVETMGGVNLQNTASQQEKTLQMDICQSGQNR